MNKNLYCALCKTVLKPGIDYSCPGGDDSCMEGTCPSCKTGFSLCVDGCVVRESNITLRHQIIQLEQRLASQKAYVVQINNEVRFARSSLKQAQQSLEGRYGHPITWTEHDSHGQCWSANAGTPRPWNPGADHLLITEVSIEVA